MGHPNWKSLEGLFGDGWHERNWPRDRIGICQGGCDGGGGSSNPEKVSAMKAELGARATPFGSMWRMKKASAKPWTRVGEIRRLDASSTRRRD